jgi:hydroxymethylglutaryl-CoA lyase
MLIFRPTDVRIVEVGPRDGLQNEKSIVSIEDRIRFIDLLTDAGLKTIEVGAFVSLKWVPQMAGTDKVFAEIHKKRGVHYTVLVPNEKGMESALTAGVKEVAVFAAASESFSKKNINCSIDESLERFKPVMKKARRHSIKVRGYVSCVMGCPYEGDIAPAAVAKVAGKLRDMGCYEISLGDTIGAGTPEKTRALLQIVKDEVPARALAAHFHDTYGRALANIRIAIEEGITVVDSATGGLGGCPYAPGASGNVATEAVAQMLQEMGISTGVDIQKVIKAGKFIAEVLNRSPKIEMGHIRSADS